MGMRAAKQGDKIMATDMHLVQPPTTSPPILVPYPFMGVIDGGLSSDVNIMGMPAATVNSTATNKNTHVPREGTFVNPPSNSGTIKKGSDTVFINGKGAARDGDIAMTCKDPPDTTPGKVVAVGAVLIG